VRCLAYFLCACRCALMTWIFGGGSACGLWVAASCLAHAWVVLPALQPRVELLLSSFSPHSEEQLDVTFPPVEPTRAKQAGHKPYSTQQQHPTAAPDAGMQHRAHYACPGHSLKHLLQCFTSAVQKATHIRCSSCCSCHCHPEDLQPGL